MIPAAKLSYARLLALAVPAALLGGAYLGQYGFGLYPCEMCWWQRYPHFAALGFAALAYVVPARSRILVALAAMSIIASGLIGGYHAGVEYRWWQGLTACTAPAAPDAGGSALDAILNAPLVRCDQVQWQLFGISLAGYNFLISLGAGLVIFRLLADGERAGG
ncbi:MAG TPA: disulfide bond formation protein B [Novosphingobium sp.]|nr:disulfide bond formation protein B [Accumulibacter sp.]HNJ47449.1 disulfide bond formation protein B [Novosphingobium sp.]HNN56012.1 disulfide bond formation protein B [Novosphingobium sp.]